MPNALEQIISSLSPEKRALLAELLRPAPEPIAIIGMSCRFPGAATSPAAFWHLLKHGIDGIGDIPADRWDSAAFYDPNPDVPGKMYARWGGFLRDIAMFDAGFFGISPAEALRLDPQQRLLLEVAWEALEHAGQSVDALAGSQTGVFIGLIPDDYALLQTDRSNPSYADDPYFASGGSSSMATGRLAYQFDLQGPNMAIDTACSSSLVATHLACQSLRDKECNLAIVGGVNAIIAPEVMVKLSKMRMMASDGRCKTFDAAADGFAIGEGCGVVILKRLSDALRDGDTIMALVRGSAVNEDGRSTSQTAPNGLAQQAVIRRALANAGVAPGHVGYVEAHGTGTALGDPIEIEALAAALCADRPVQQPLAVGAVKTNIGHQVAAAGVAGLIKTVLALQHETIPPHLNLRERSPHMDWEAHSLVVPTTATPWPRGERPRVAGVSSFGWAGTNAHVVLEEAPAAGESGPARPWQLLALSAKTASALDAATANLAAHLRAHADLSLADAAYTLHMGRCSFAQRRILVCRDRADALAALTDGDSARLLSGQAAARRTVAFLFPGVGDHYAGMAQELYENEPCFRATVDQCCAILQPLLGQDLRDLLFPTGAAQPNRNGAPSLDLRALLGRNGARAADDPLHQTALAQPALFIVEYALAQLLIQWSIRPQAMLGYSLGEYVAATLAGVLSLEDGLTLVARRAQLIQSLPTGALLAVFLAEADVRPFLAEGIDLAAVNGPSTCVLAGPPAAIAALEHTLLAREVACRRVPTTHAFHSAMLAPIAGELTALVGTLRLHPPRIPYLSNVTGTWITDAQATDPAYWAQHMLATVRFAEGVGALLDSPEQVLLEVGPGQALGSFVKAHPACERVRYPLVLGTLPAAHERGADQAALLGVLGKLWLLGVPVDWAALYEGQRRRRVPLPTYPFERQRFWFDPLTPAPSAVAVPTRAVSYADLMAVPRQPIDDWFYLPCWHQSAPLLPTTAGLLAGGQCWLLFEDQCGISTSIAGWLAAHNQPIVSVRPGQGYARHSDTCYSVAPRARADYESLLRDLRDQGLLPSRVVHAWSIGAAPDLERTLDLGFYSLLCLAQSLGDLALDGCRITVLSSDIQQVSGAECICPAKATIMGPVRITPFEYSALRCRSVDIALPAPDSWQAEALLAQLVGELTHDPDETVVALRGDRRWVQAFEPLRMPALEAQRPPLRERGVYLITGGLGGIGLAIAEDLARTVCARLVLLGRSGLPGREAWPAIAAGQAASDAVAERVRRLLALEALGAEVLVVQADVADAAQVRDAVRQALERFGAINGVIHAAGVPGMGLIALKTPEQAAQVFAPKLHGTLALAEALRHTPLDFMALFSSIVAATGGAAGQVDYCAANAFLDAYAARYAHSHGMTVSIGWGEWQWNAWEHTLSGYPPEIQAFFRGMRLKIGMQPAEGAEAFQRVLARGLPNVLVAPQDMRQTRALLERSSIASLLRPAQPAPAYPRPALGASYVAPRNELEATVAAVWGEQLGIAEVGINDNFFELGGNSLIGFELLAKLRRRLNIEQIPGYILYEAPTVGAMAQLFAAGSSTPGAVAERQDRGAKRRERQHQRRR
jgi:acyl transferase domain-containing protein